MNTQDKVFHITQEGLDKLNIEINHLIKEMRPKIIEDLKEARSQGDLSENAEYESARERQAEVENRIKELEYIIAKTKIIEKTQHQGKNKIVSTGSIVSFKNITSKVIETIQIVGDLEADPFNNKLSYKSPIAKALLNKEVKDVIEIIDISSSYKIEILTIE